MKYEPLVTVVIPVYNGANYVSEAIESAISQTYSKIEIIVINDGSKDNTDEVVMPYLEKIMYIKKENGGVSTALNYAIKHMNGEWMSWLSHDDLYLPDKILRQVERLNEIMKSDQLTDIHSYVLSCQDQRIDENRKVLPHNGSTHPTFNNKYNLICKEICSYSIGGCTVFASKKAYQAMGGFDEKNRTISDADMWFRLMLNDYKFDFSQEILVQSRYHKNMVSIKRNDLVKIEKDNFYAKQITIIRDYLDNDDLLNMALAMEMADLKKAVNAALELYRGDKKAVEKILRKARCKRVIKGVLRGVYRQIKWGLRTK